HCPSVCRSPGPSLSVSSPLSLTANLDLYLSPANSFQPLRSLPLNNAVGPSGLSLTLRNATPLPPRATPPGTAAGLAPPVPLAFPAPPSRPPWRIFGVTSPPFLVTSSSAQPVPKFSRSIPWVPLRSLSVGSQPRRTTALPSFFIWYCRRSS